MPGERLSMRKIRKVLRLRFVQGLSKRGKPATEFGSGERLSQPGEAGWKAWPLP